MENQTVALSVIEDLIHWPLPSSDPSASSGANPPGGGHEGSAGYSDDLLHGDVPLTAGAVEELNEEPLERRQARYTAVRRLVSLSLAMGKQWTVREVVPYLLRCLEEDDAQLSFSVGMAVIDFSSLSPSSSPLSVRELMPVVALMGTSVDAGVRSFLVEVVIPMLFFGVPLECNVDLQDWKKKFLKTPAHGNKLGEGDEMLTTRSNARHTDSVGDGSDGQRHMSQRSALASMRKCVDAFSDSWDPFKINLHARKLRSRVSDYLINVCEDASERGGEAATTVRGSANAAGSSGYLGGRKQREAVHRRWNLFLSLMDTMLQSPCVASKASAVQCIANVFSSVTWAMKEGEKQKSIPASTLMSSVGELAEFTFVTTRTHVGRSVLGCTVAPCKELMKLLVDYQVVVPGSSRETAVGKTLKSGVGSTSDIRNKQSTKMRLNVSTNNQAWTLGSTFGALTDSKCGVWDVCAGNCEQRMHSVLCASLLRSVPLLLNWTSILAAGTSTDYEFGLSFSSVCDMFKDAVTPLVSHTGGDVCDSKGDRYSVGSSSCRSGLGASKLFTKENDVLPRFTGNVTLVLESSAGRDLSVAEAVLDGLQRLLDELQRPCAVEGILGRSVTGNPATNEEKTLFLRRLYEIYRDCVVHMATVPSWRTRWLVTQRLPELTGSLFTLLYRIGRHHPIEGPLLVEKCVDWICHFSQEIWADKNMGDGELQEMVQDDEEEVRCVIGVCAARVFAAVGQGMFRLTFPGGVVINMKGDDSGKRQPDAGAVADEDINCESHISTRLCKAEGGISGGIDASAMHVLLSDKIVMQNVPRIFNAIFLCCTKLLRDKEERVRSGAAAALSVLSRTLSTMVAVCNLSTSGISKAEWADYLNQTTASLMSLLGDASPTVQLALVSELVALLSTHSVGTGPTAAFMGNFGSGEALRLRESALLACLHSLAKNDIWRYRAQYATLLSEMCLRFLAPNSLAATEMATTHTPRSVHLLEVGLRESHVMDSSRKAGGVVVAEDGADPLHCFAKEKLLPLLVDVLFDKVKAVRDSALDSVVLMCERLFVARRQLKQQMASSRYNQQCERGGRLPSGMSRETNRGAVAHRTTSNIFMKRQTLQSRFGDDDVDDDVFVSDTLWPLIVKSPKAMATYLSRSSLLRIAVRMGVDKRSVLLPLLDQLGHDPVLNVRLVVAKELYNILSGSVKTEAIDGRANSSASTKVVFTEEERNGAILDLLRLLVEDKSADVRYEAAKALKICF
uniref:Uncharacterized protein n=1 Tax=Trypanosoma congolense (strain IL3000) TaxID=1068625 RepID=G0US05_TRYCI|nr:conserved hypothetical protein [Trypanosoma congolense IL3000]